MEIKLHDSVTGLSGSGIQKRPNATGLGAASESGAGVSPETSLRLTEIKQRLLNESAVDNVKVAKIADAVESGSYRVNPQRVAEMLIDMERILPDFG